MSDESQEQIPQNQQPEAPKNDKEYNFSQLRKQLESEREARARMEEELQNLKAQSSKSRQTEDDDYDEPYIDKKYLNKTLQREAARIAEEVEKRTEQRLMQRMVEDKKSSWLKANPDFYEVMEHAQKFAERDPELAETILEMPEGFERQKLVYKNIKALGLHKPEQPKPNIQDQINKNRQSPYYQPTQMGSAPYGVVNGGKDYSPQEGKSAYDHMKSLQQRLRLN